jgi:hypothetical protein
MKLVLLAAALHLAMLQRRLLLMRSAFAKNHLLAYQRRSENAIDSRLYTYLARSTKTTHNAAPFSDHCFRRFLG